MDPWSVLGWIVLACVALVALLVLFVLAGYGVTRARKFARYWRTRSVAPAAGQMWMQHGSPLYITNIYPNGRIGIRTSMGSSYGAWSDSPEEWRNRVRIARCTLETQP